jgi:predicted RNase H-like nuclease (RuvC/YqgF family)
MSIDYEFVIDSLERYAKHLSEAEISLKKNIASYEKQIEELKRLVSFKPQTYTSRYEEVQDKIKEVDIKLSYIVPRRDKIYEQLDELRKLGK